jgi:methyltransferase (TIGR00027 family)
MRAEQPSVTAALIAEATIYVARDPRLGYLVPDGAAAWSVRCLRAVSARRLGVTRALSHPLLRWVPAMAERATVPGLLLHFILRKRWIEDAVRDRLAAGCAQVVVVGAGFDTLAVRLGAAFRHVAFLEIDHPATQAAKRLALSDGAAPGNVHLVAADLGQVDLGDALVGAATFRRDAPSVFVVEGMLMYLDDARVGAVFAALRTLQEGSGVVIFTVMEPTADGAARFHNATPLVRRLLAAWNEPFRSTLPRAAIGPFLARSGLVLRALADSDGLRARYVPDDAAPPLARGELVVMAER